MSNLIFVSFVCALVSGQVSVDLEPFRSAFFRLVPKGLHTRLFNTISGYGGLSAVLLLLMYTVAHAYAPMYNMC